MVVIGISDYPEEFKDYSNNIINCGNFGIIKTKGRAGGIAAYLKGRILNCCNKNTITGEDSVGGIAGVIEGSVKNCYNIGNITGNRVGGILNAGPVTGATAANCYSIGTVNASSSSVGDIIGGGNVSQNNKIINCYTKNEKFTISDLGEAFVDDAENVNGGYPVLYWE